MKAWTCPSWELDTGYGHCVPQQKLGWLENLGRRRSSDTCCTWVVMIVCNSEYSILGKDTVEVE